MAQEIVAPLYGNTVIGPGMYIALADQTATTSVQSFTTWGGKAVGAAWVSAMIYLKTFVVGSATVYPIFTLEVADNAAFTTNPRRIAWSQAPLSDAIAAVPGTNPPWSHFLAGFCPDGRRQQVRVRVTLSGTSSLVYDVVITGN